MTVTSDGSVWFTASLDEAQPTCPRCFAGIARMSPSGELSTVPREAYDLAPNAFLSPYLLLRVGAQHILAHSRVRYSDIFLLPQ